MEFVEGDGIHLRESPEEMARAALLLLAGEGEISDQSHLGRAQVEQLYGFDATYARLAHDLFAFACQEARKTGKPE